MKSARHAFLSKMYDIREESNFVIARTAQWDLYFQSSFCDKLQLKESIFFDFWKLGSSHTKIWIVWQKLIDSS